MITDYQRAYNLQHEWIVDNDGNVCIRPMMFYPDGRRRLHFQRCEFVPYLEAHARLRQLKAEAGIKPGDLEAESAS